MGEMEGNSGLQETDQTADIHHAASEVHEADYSRLTGQSWIE